MAIVFCEHSFDVVSKDECIEVLARATEMSFNALGALHPQFDLVKLSGWRRIVSGGSRDELYPAVREMVRAFHPDLVAFASEVWTLPEAEHAKTGLRPSDHPQREEALMLMVEEPDGSVEVFQWKIDRSGDSARTVSHARRWRNGPGGIRGSASMFTPDPHAN